MSWDLSKIAIIILRVRKGSRAWQKRSLTYTKVLLWTFLHFQISILLNDNISSLRFRNRFITSPIRVHYVEARVKMVTLGTQDMVCIYSWPPKWRFHMKYWHRVLSQDFKRKSARGTWQDKGLTFIPGVVGGVVHKSQSDILQEDKLYTTFAMSTSTLVSFMGALGIFFFKSPLSNDPFQTWAPLALSIDFQMWTRIFEQMSKYVLSSNIDSHMHYPIHTCSTLYLSCLYTSPLKVSSWTMIHTLLKSKFYQLSCSALSILTDLKLNSSARKTAFETVSITRITGLDRVDHAILTIHHVQSRSVTFLLCSTISEAWLYYEGYL